MATERYGEEKARTSYRPAEVSIETIRREARKQLEHLSLARVEADQARIARTLSQAQYHSRRVAAALEIIEAHAQAIAREVSRY